MNSNIYRQQPHLRSHVWEDHGLDNIDFSIGLFKEMQSAAVLGCELCGRDVLPPQRIHGVYLCSSHKEEHRRGLLPRVLLERFKRGEWKPQKPSGKSGHELLYGVNNEQ